MLEELLNLVTSHSQDQIVNNPAIPNEQNHAAIQETTNGVLSGLQSVIAGGGLQSVLGMFTGNSPVNANNGVVQSITNNVVGGLMSKLGINNGVAQSIATSLVPSILGSLVKNTQDSNQPGFNLNSLMGLLTSGTANNQQTTGGFDFQGLVTKAVSGGLDANHDGKMGLDDVMSLVTNSASQNQSQYGGFSGLLKGLMGS